MTPGQLTEYAQEQKLIKEGKTLVPHTGRPPFAGGRAARKEGEGEAAELKLTGVVRKLFLREREQGWIASGQFVEAQEQGLLDEFITPITALLGASGFGAAGPAFTGHPEQFTVHGPLPASTTLKTNAKTGRAEAVQHASGVESVEKAVPEIPSLIGEIGTLIKTYGIRLLEILAGGALVLFGLVTLARGGQAPPVPKAIPVPV